MNNKGNVLEDIVTLEPMRLQYMNEDANAASATAISLGVGLFGQASSGCQGTNEATNQNAFRHSHRARDRRGL